MEQGECRHDRSLYYKGKNLSFSLRAMTMIDPASNWFEIAALPVNTSPSSDLCQQLFGDTWLTCYSCPQEKGFDNSSEFKAVFRDFCTNFSMRPKPTTSTTTR